MINVQYVQKSGLKKENIGRKSLQKNILFSWLLFCILSFFYVRKECFHFCHIFTCLLFHPLRSHSVSEKDLPWLGEMHQMRHLVILDARPGHCPLSSDLLCKLQDLTGYRVHVVLSGDAIDPAACLCDLY